LGLESGYGCRLSIEQVLSAAGDGKGCGQRLLERIASISLSGRPERLRRYARIA
jgi:hypothetical protein